MVNMITSRLEVNEDIGKISLKKRGSKERTSIRIDINEDRQSSANYDLPSLQWKGAAMDQRMRFIENHVARFHTDIDCFPFAVDDFQ